MLHQPMDGGFCQDEQILYVQFFPSIMVSIHNNDLDKLTKEHANIFLRLGFGMDTILRRASISN